MATTKSKSIFSRITGSDNGPQEVTVDDGIDVFANQARDAIVNKDRIKILQLIKKSRAITDRLSKMYDKLVDMAKDKAIWDGKSLQIDTSDKPWAKRTSATSDRVNDPIAFLRQITGDEKEALIAGGAITVSAAKARDILGKARFDSLPHITTESITIKFLKNKN